MDAARDPYGVLPRPIEEHPLEAYALAFRALEAAGIRHAVGGGLAVAYYARPRPTKDLDIFIRPCDTEETLNTLARAGFTALDMDANWLRKAKWRDVEIDIIVRSAGPITLTDDELDRAVHAVHEGVSMALLAPEDLLIRKIYAMRDDGMDWQDALAILERQAASLHWRLLDREDLDPRPLAAFLLVASVRLNGMLPPGLVAHHVSHVSARL